MKNDLMISMRMIAFLCLLASLASGCGKNDKSLDKKVGEKIGQQATDFTKGIGKGIDQQMMIDACLSPQVQAIGLTNTIAKSLGIGSTNGFSIYLIASQNISNTLIARALNNNGVEVGRSRKSVVMQKDDAQYVTFEFDEQMDSAMVKRYEIGF